MQAGFKLFLLKTAAAESVDDADKSDETEPKQFGLQNQNNGLKEAKRYVQLIRTAESELIITINLPFYNTI